MLKKIVIGVAVLLVLALAAGGIEFYRLYSGIDSIVNKQIPQLRLCSRGTASGQGPATGGSSAAAATGGTRTPAKGKQGAAGSGGNRQPCDPVKGPLPTLSGKKRINILLLGSDNDRKGMPLLSQTMMVVTIDPVHKKVGMLSIPRDFWVYIPGVSTLGDPTTYHKIDAALAFGSSGSRAKNREVRFLRGVAVAEATVEYNFHIPIHYYAWVGLTGFIKVINTLGGICLDAQHPIVDDLYPADLTGGNPFAYTRIYLPAGPQCMNGFTALEYVRSRHADLVGDFGRGARQEQMLLAIRKKANQLGLTDIGTVDSLVHELGGFVKSDVGGQVIPMTTFARSLKPSAIHRVVLSPPRYSAVGTAWDGESIVIPYWRPIERAVHKMFAPVSSVGHHKHAKPKPRQITPAIALKQLTRVSGATPLSHRAALPAPSGPTVQGWIYFDLNGNIWSFNGSNAYQVTHGGNISDPALTPNGKTLVYAGRPSPLYSDIFLRNRPATRVHQLTHDASTDGRIQDNVWAYDTAISPDGKTVIYASDAYKLGYNASGAIDLALYKYNVTTHASSEITMPPVGAGGDADPRFDPANPNQVIFTRYYYLPNQSIASRLMLLNLRTGQTRGITPYAGRISQPAWQPGGSHIAYVQAHGQGSAIYVAYYANGKLHTGRARKVATGMVSEPVFSPDGKHIAFFKLVGNAFQLWEVNLKNGIPSSRPYRLLSENGLVASSPLVWTR